MIVPIPYTRHYNPLLIINHGFLAQKLKNFLFLVHKLSVIVTALQYNCSEKWGKNIQAAAYNGARMVDI